MCRTVAFGLSSPGKNAHTSSPFALHGGVPWGYHSIDDAFYLRANACSDAVLRENNTQCANCRDLLSNIQVQGILHRIEYGVHQNSLLVFHPILGLMEIARRRAEQARGMRLRKLNDARKIGQKMETIDDYKELTMAIVSGKMARVGNLLRSGFANHAGVCGLVRLCLRAKVGKVRAAHDAMSRAVGLLLLRLGGTRVAEIGHCVLGLLSISTLQHNMTIRLLLLCWGKPEVEEIEHNLDSCQEPLTKSSPSDSTGTVPCIVHQVLMLDEIAKERRPRYDDQNNKIVDNTHTNFLWTLHREQSRSAL